MKDWFIIICYSSIILLFFGVAIFTTAVSYANNETIEITIKEKYIKNSGKTGKYLVVDTNNTTYEITDLKLKGKFNSTDIYNQLEVGQTYKVEVSGKRIHFFSMYRNINKIIE